METGLAPSRTNPHHVQIYRNSFAVDFWRHGDRRSLVEYNKLPINEIWYLCNEFHVRASIPPPNIGVC